MFIKLIPRIEKQMRFSWWSVFCVILACLCDHIPTQTTYYTPLKQRLYMFGKKKKNEKQKVI